MRFLSLFQRKETKGNVALPEDVKRVFEILKRVRDPETEMNVVEEGLVYGVTVEQKKVMVWFEFVAATPNCHFCQPLALNIQRRIVRDTIDVLQKEGFRTIEIYNEYGFLLERFSLKNGKQGGEDENNKS